METFLSIVLSFSLGFGLGSWLKGFIFDRLDWQCLRWSKDCFGYRPIVAGQKIYRGDKVMMALIIDPDHWPEEGIAAYGEENP